MFDIMARVVTIWVFYVWLVDAPSFQFFQLCQPIVASNVIQLTCCVHLPLGLFFGAVKLLFHARRSFLASKQITCQNWCLVFVNFDHVTYFAAWIEHWVSAWKCSFSVFSLEELVQHWYTLSVIECKLIHVFSVLIKLTCLITYSLLSQWL